MSDAGRYDTYRWQGADERLFVVGEGRDVLILPALFAEANRTRAFTVAVARALAAAGLRCTLPDLPGTLESTAELAGIAWNDWCDAVGQLVDTLDRPVVLAIRGGGLLPTPTHPRLHFAATSGDRLLRDLLRARLASDKEAGRATTMAALAEAVAAGRERLAGFDLAPALSQPLAAAAPPPGAHEARLASDPAPADSTVDGTPLWRRAEPGRDDAMADQLAAIVAEWSVTCDAG